VTLREPDGGTTTLPLNSTLPEGPPAHWHGITGELPLRLADGAGNWTVTKVSDATGSATVSLPFRILRGSVVTLDQPPTVIAPTPSAISGSVQVYTPTGALVGQSGRAVSIVGAGTQPDTTATTNVSGRFSAQVMYSRTADVVATVGRTTTHAAAWSDQKTAHRLAALQQLSASPTAYTGVWWRVSGVAYPGALWTHLAIKAGDTWVLTQSFGSSDNDGSFARWWKPDTAGTYTLRVEIGGPGYRLDNMPLYRELTVTVRPRPTTLTGTANPTSATVVRPSTRMSTYGRLSAMYTTGATGPFAGQKVVIQTRPRSNPTGPYNTVATATTTSTGYYYANWNASVDADVRVAFLSPYTSIASAYRYIRYLDVT